jgi:uncharacterized membrane protein HdeD (DUF308 family)
MSENQPEATFGDSEPVEGVVPPTAQEVLAGFLDASWKAILVRGVLAVGFGVLAMAWPKLPLLTFVLLWGAWALLDGIAAIVAAFRGGSTGQRVLAALIGVVAIAAGLLAFFRPGLTVSALVWLLGIWLIARGVVELIGAFTASGSARWIIVLLAAVDLVLGILLVLNPGRSALAIAWALGLLAVLWGLVFIALAFAVRKTSRTVAAA